jgi:hypothetical protein
VVVRAFHTSRFLNTRLSSGTVFRRPNSLFLCCPCPCPSLVLPANVGMRAAEVSSHRIVSLALAALYLFVAATLRLFAKALARLARTLDHAASTTTNGVLPPPPPNRLRRPSAFGNANPHTDVYFITNYIHIHTHKRCCVHNPSPIPPPSSTTLLAGGQAGEKSAASRTRVSAVSTPSRAADGFTAFLEVAGEAYGYGGQLDGIREREFSRLQGEWKAPRRRGPALPWFQLKGSERSLEGWLG